jgi:hypothetical protein
MLTPPSSPAHLYLVRHGGESGDSQVTLEPGSRGEWGSDVGSDCAHASGVGAGCTLGNADLSWRSSCTTVCGALLCWLG